MNSVMIMIIVVAILAIAIVVNGLMIVQQSQTVIIERLGKYYRTLNSGVNVIIPFIDRPRPMKWRYTVAANNGETYARFTEVSRIDLRETVYDFARQSVITRDNVVTEINAILYFQIVDPISAIYEISNLPDAIEKLTQTSLRNVIGEMDLDQTLTSRDTINSKLRTILDEATNKWGVKVNRVELQDINLLAIYVMRWKSRCAPSVINVHKSYRRKDKKNRLYENLKVRCKSPSIMLRVSVRLRY